jgi:hypothetical protein
MLQRIVEAGCREETRDGDPVVESDGKQVVTGHGTNSKMKLAALIGALAAFPGYETIADNTYQHMKSEGYFKSPGRNRPDLMRPKEQGRNERCNCKSGLKYKNCCGK